MYYLQKLLYCPANKGCLLWALAVWYLQTAAVFPFASFCPHTDSYKIQSANNDKLYLDI